MAIVLGLSLRKGCGLREGSSNWIGGDGGPSKQPDPHLLCCFPHRLVVNKFLGFLAEANRLKLIKIA